MPKARVFYRKVDDGRVINNELPINIGEDPKIVYVGINDKVFHYAGLSLETSEFVQLKCYQTLVFLERS